MNLHYEDETVKLWHGDCIEVMRTLPDSSVDSVVCDPPYGLEFMGKDWDSFKTGRGEKYAAGGSLDVDVIASRSGKGGAGPSYVNRPAKRCALCGKQAWSGSPCTCPDPQWVMDNSPLHSFQQWCELWTAECLRVLKPGGHMLAFGGTRTWHRLACAVEDAGFEIRDSIAWLYATGFPKSLDVSKAIDKRAEVNEETKRRIALVAEVIRTHREAAGLERAEVSEAVVGTRSGACWNWEHQQLPSVEMWPAIKRVLSIPDKFDGLIEGDRAQFIAAEREVIGTRTTGIGTGRGSVAYIADSDNRDLTAPATDAAQQWQGWGTALKPAFEPVVVARKPLSGTVAANVLAHGTGALNIEGCRVEGAKPDTTRGASVNASSMNSPLGGQGRILDDGRGRWPANVVLDESQAEVLDEQSRDDDVSVGPSRFFYVAKAPADERVRVNGTAHPTVKPLALMRWLVRLVTPPGGTVLEPFAGSGTTVEACLLERFHCLAIEREEEYLPLIKARIYRQRNPVEAIKLGGGDLGLFSEETA